MAGSSIRRSASRSRSASRAGAEAQARQIASSKVRHVASVSCNPATLARDLRILVRERLTEGDTDDQVRAYLVDRYGEFVLLKPTSGGANTLLWLAGPILFVLAAGTGALYIRRRSTAEPRTEAGLSEAEQARLDEILKD